MALYKDQREDDIAATLQLGDVVFYYNDDLPRSYAAFPTDKNFPPTLRARIVLIHDVRTVTLQPLLDDAGTPFGGPRRVIRHRDGHPWHNTWAIIY